MISAFVGFVIALGFFPSVYCLVMWMYHTRQLAHHREILRGIHIELTRLRIHQTLDWYYKGEPVDKISCSS